MLVQHLNSCSSFKLLFQEWGWFESICQDYANASESHVKKLYEFLSVNLENMTDEERSRREKQLFKEMEDRIRRTSPQEIR